VSGSRSSNASLRAFNAGAVTSSTPGPTTSLADAAGDEHHREEVARLQAERAAEQAKAEEAAAELERLRSRGFWSRLFGGTGTPQG